MELIIEVESHSIRSVGASTDVISDTSKLVFQINFSGIFMGYFLHQLFLAIDIESHFITSIGAATGVITDTSNCFFK